MNFEFDIGTTESHQVRFLTSAANGKATLTVDGDIVKQETFRFWIPLHRRYELRVGSSEVHDVAIDVVFARVARKFTQPTCTAYVDGEVVGVS
jgi:hypothetical protein